MSQPRKLGWGWGGESSSQDAGSRAGASAVGETRQDSGCYKEAGVHVSELKKEM